MVRNKISDKTLFNFCATYRQQFGQIQDATRFRNELGLRFYNDTNKPQELFDRCVQQKFLKYDAGNIIIKVGGRHDGY